MADIEFSLVEEKPTLDGTEFMLGASSATQTVPQKYSVAKAYMAGQADSKVINVRDYIDGEPVNTGNYSVAFQQAIDYAFANGGIVYVPSGSYGLATTVTVTVSMFGDNARGQAGNATRLYAQMNDGSACLKANDQERLVIENIAIRPLSIDTLDPTNNLNCIGIDFGFIDIGTLPEDYAINRSRLSDIYIQGCQIGIKATGWINNFENILIRYAVLGFSYTHNNDCVFDIAIEHCLQGFILQKGSGTVFTRLSEEGFVGNTPSIIRDQQGLTFSLYRTEQTDRAVPWLTVGDTIDYVNAFTIVSGEWTSNTAGPNIVLDRVSNFSLGMKHWHRSDNNETVSRTINTISDNGYVIADVPFQSAVLPVHALRKRQNVFPDPKMQRINHGANVIAVRGTATEETTNTLHGKALRVTSTIGETSTSYARLDIELGSTLAHMEGKLWSLGVWVFLPDLPAFADGTIKPYMQLVSGSTLIATVTTGFTVGQWNFVSGRSVSVVPATPTEVEVRYYARGSGVAVASAGEYIIIGETVVAEGNCQHDLMKGNWEDHPSNPLSITGGAQTIVCTQAEAAALQGNTLTEFNTGDRLVYSDPVDGGFTGEVLTTTIWKTYGPISETV
jgi:hypothetical protein